MADNKLANLMRARGVAVKALGTKSGVSWRTIQDYYQGRRKSYSAQAALILALADALGVHPRDVIDKPDRGHELAWDDVIQRD